jgi:hypothetical protein
MDTIFFIPKDNVPRARAKDVTYSLITCLIRPEKTVEPNRTRLVAGGDRVHHPFNAGTPTANLLTIKLLINRLISTPGARFFMMDINYILLYTPMTKYEYMQLKLSDMPDDVIAHYHLLDIAHPTGMSTAKSNKACTGSRKRGSLRSNYWKRLKEHGYTQSKTTPGLWTHEWHPITFSLIVDNFRVKYIKEEYAQHRLQMVQKYYMCSFKKEGKRYCGLTIKGDYVGKKVHLLMPSYIEKALKRFQHPPPIVLQDQLHQHIRKTYGAKVQEANPLNTYPPLNKAGKKFIQEVTGVLLYLAQAVDSTMLTALSSLASKQAAPTEKTMQKCLQF